MFKSKYTEKGIFLFSFILILFLLYSALSSMNVFFQRECFVFLLLFLWSLGEIQENKGFFKYTFVGIFCVLFATFVYYLWASQGDLLLDKGIFGLNSCDVFTAWILISSVIICTSRKTGLALGILSLLFLLYAFWGKYIPGLWGHRGYTFTYIANYISWTLEGIFSAPIAAVVNFVGLYVLFGELLDAFGAGKFFIDLSYRFTSKFKGGTAQAAVLSSALMGSINGSAVANVVTTGTFTIPLMEKMGYKPKYAAGIEAVASTGGQIAPPVMGAAAFVMADLTGIGYQTIVIAALIPALLYYASLSFSVYFHACKAKLFSNAPAPAVLAHRKGDFILLLPLVLLLYLLLIKGYSPQYSVVMAMALLLVIGFIRTGIKENRLPYKELVQAILSTGKVLVMIGSACMAAGIVIGIVNMTGIGIQFSQAVFGLAGNSFFLLLVFVMTACLILGMGLPSTAAYCIVAIVGAPALMNWGVDKLTAHLFVFYFAIISFITPPIGIASYAAASVAKSKPMETAWQAFLLGLAGFIIPFQTVYRPTLLLQQGFNIYLVFDFLCTLCALFLLSASLEGWLLQVLKLWERAFCFLCVVLLLIPYFPINALVILFCLILFTLKTIRQKEKERSNLPFSP